MGKRVKKIKQVSFVDLEEVSFEDFDRTMKKIVQAKPTQKKPPKEEQKKDNGHSRRLSFTKD